VCHLQGWDAVVEVEARVGLSVLGDVTVRGRARAGPSAADPPIPAPSHDSRSNAAPMITPSGRRRQPNGLRARRRPTRRRTAVRRPRTDPGPARSPSVGHRSATVAGMARPRGAYWNRLDGPGNHPDLRP
jgi:hypothetical protein